MSALVLQQIYHHFRGPWGREGRTVLHGIDLRLEPGERVGLIGESGAGKSTLARVALGLIRPTSGKILLFNEDTSGWSAARWRAVRPRAQLLFQDPVAMLNPAMTLDAILMEGARLHAPDRDPRREVARVLEAVDLQGRDAAHPRELSGGEQRRAGLARILLTKPKLLIADEPTTGLDASRKVELIRVLFGALPEDCAVLLISHDLHLVHWACPRALVMRDGAWVDSFAREDLCAPERHPYTQTLTRAGGLPCS